MKLEDIKAFLETNKDSEDVKNYISELSKVTIDGVEQFITSEDGKKWLGKQNDSFFSRGLETWKKNNLESEIDKEVKKRFPEKSEKDIELEKVKAELEKIKNDAFRKELTNKAIKTLNEKKLPLSIVDLLVSQDEESTNKNIETLEQVFSTHIESLVNERLKTGYTPPKGDNKNVDISKMSMEEYAKYWKDQNK